MVEKYLLDYAAHQIGTFYIEEMYDGGRLMDQPMNWIECFLHLILAAKFAAPLHFS
ncbi:MAG: hypothetical protein KZQ94_21865 [Candidatus Thiodiazotropha sp. (ex Troendleina suluensis)]|nr:hypothetical protein [Candidatus Thiodiazotropha sp. (ex Troendleina suluensis)]